MKIVLKNNPEFINTCIDYLLESFKKGDKNTKKLILQIFEEYTESSTLERTINTILATIDTEPDQNLANGSIETVVKVCRKNHYSNVEDLEWFVNTVLSKLLLTVKSPGAASLIAYTLIVHLLLLPSLTPCCKGLNNSSL